MRTNPFAPEVPCHRVLAADGSLGGYKGSWIRKTDDHHDQIGVDKLAEKKRLLEEEGVAFDEKGRPSGERFCDFRGLEVEGWYLVPRLRKGMMSSDDDDDSIEGCRGV
jgi:methylated-DNA-[protein]-cysteine S-methyltransferase